MFKTTKFGSALLLVYILASCSQVLQSVDLSINAQDKSAQDEFNVIEKTLTLQGALNLANTPYPDAFLRMDKAALDIYQKK